MAEQAAAPSNKRMQAVGTLGFWLTAPAVLSGIAGLIIRGFVPWLDWLAVALVMYGLFMIWGVMNRAVGWIRLPLMIVDIACFMAAAYVQISPLTKDGTKWLAWAAAIFIGLVWIAIFALLMIRQGSTKPGQHPSTKQNADALIKQIKNGHMDADLQERLISIVKLSSSKGDITVDTAELIMQLGKEAQRKDRESRIEAAKTLLESLKMGLFDKERVEKEIATLLHVPDSVLKQSEEAEPRQRKIVPNEEGDQVVTVDWGHDSDTWRKNRRKLRKGNGQ